MPPNVFGENHGDHTPAGHHHGASHQGALRRRNAQIELIFSGDDPEAIRAAKPRFISVPPTLRGHVHWERCRGTNASLVAWGPGAAAPEGSTPTRHALHEPPASVTHQRFSGPRVVGDGHKVRSGRGLVGLAATRVGLAPPCSSRATRNGRPGFVTRASFSRRSHHQQADSHHFQGIVRVIKQFTTGILASVEGSTVSLVPAALRRCSGSVHSIAQDQQAVVWSTDLRCNLRPIGQGARIADTTFGTSSTNSLGPMAKHPDSTALGRLFSINPAATTPLDSSARS